MKRLLTGSLAIAALALSYLSPLTVTKANAQTANPPSPPMSWTQCGALTNSPFMCVKNGSPYPITDIVTVLPSMWSPTYVPSGWIHIPGGAIPSGGSTIVKFNTTFFGPGCVQNVIVKTAAGTTHNFPNVDVCRTTSLPIMPW